MGRHHGGGRAGPGEPVKRVSARWSGVSASTVWPVAVWRAVSPEPSDRPHTVSMATAYAAIAGPSTAPQTSSVPFSGHVIVLVCQHSYRSWLFSGRCAVRCVVVKHIRAHVMRKIFTI